LLEKQVFKANDIRGIVGREWDEAGAAALGAAYVAALGLEGGRFALGRDMRLRGESLSRAFAQAAVAAGAEVLDVGLVSTDQLWFVSGDTGLPGIQFTASHNPAEYNGVKFCLPGAAPVTAQLLERIQEVATTAEPRNPPPDWADKVETRDTLSAYAAKLHSLVQLPTRRLKVIVDSGNGMAALTTPAVLGTLNLDVVSLFPQLDGTFPNHPANPLDPANLVTLRAAVVEHQADIGLAFDGDADRCFIIDERGDAVDPAQITALIAASALARDPGAAIVVNTITSRAVREVVARAGGRVVVSPVGHTHMKAAMAKENAIFGGEHSGHYYFREFWNADTGMLAALHVIAALSGFAGTLSQLAATLPSYPHSGEINTRVSDPEAIKAKVAASFAGDLDTADGIFISGGDWWLSVRESNTEPLLRLNVEAADVPTMEALRDRALAIIRA
jgi:phosphomannomutase